MGYVQDSLVPGEQILAKAAPHWGMFVGPIVVVGAGGLALLAVLMGGLFAPTDEQMVAILSPIVLCCVLPYLVVSAVGLGSAAARFFSTEFAVTDRRIIAKTGFLRRRSLELVLAKVESIGVDQPLLGRMLNYGSIVVSGSGGTRQAFPNIAQPMRLRDQINTILAKVR